MTFDHSFSAGRGHSDAARAHQVRLARLREENGARVAEWLRTVDIATVAEISEHVGLSKPTVKERLDDLVAANAVIEGAKLDPSQQGSGRPASRFSFNPDAGYAIGVELQISTDRIVVSNVAGEIIARDDHGADPNAELVHRLDAVGTRLQEIVPTIGRDLRKAHGVGIALPEPADSDELGRKLADRFGVPVLFDSSLNAAAISEGSMGAAIDEANFLLVSLRLGLRTSAVIRGELYRGTDGHAGELFPPQEEKSAATFAQLAAVVAALDPGVLYVDIADAAEVRQHFAEKYNDRLTVRVETPSLGPDGPVFGATLMALADVTARLLGPASTSPNRLYTK